MKLKLPFHWSWILIIFGFWMSANQLTSVLRLSRSGDKMKEAQEKLSQLESQKSDLQKKLASVDNPEYIERELRDKLGYGREGETILILPNQNANPNSQAPITKKEDPNWKQWATLWLGWGSDPQP